MRAFPTLTPSLIASFQLVLSAGCSAKLEEVLPHFASKNSISHVATRAGLPLPIDANSRGLQIEDSSPGNSDCSICGNSTAFPTEIPQSQVYAELFEFLEVPENTTCGEIENILLDNGNCDFGGYFFRYCCSSPFPRYQCESTIRRSILNEDYDDEVPPVLGGPGIPPLNVSVGVTYEAVERIDVQTGIGSFYLTVELRWNDPRLTWEVDAENCAEMVNMRASTELELNEIWVPDFDLVNYIEGLEKLPEVMASVYFDGTVVWTRSGNIDALCQFSGLSKIPFDTLGCQLIFGPYSRFDDELIDYILINGTGINFAEWAPVYQEYFPVPELAESGQTYDELFVYFTFYFQRAERYYMSNLVVPTIILTYLSFGVFLLDLRMGERLAYGVALALVITAQQILTVERVPISSERLWINRFAGWSFYWVCLGVMESVFVAYVFYIRKDDLSAKRDWGESDAESLNSASVSPQEIEPIVQDDQPSDGEKFFTEEGKIIKEEGKAGPHNLERMDYGGSMVLRDGRAFSRWHAFSLRKLDKFFFFFTIASYTLFIIVMFATVPRWGASVQSVEFDEDTPFPERDYDGI